MYFIEQIKTQFLYTLAAFEVGNNGDVVGTPVVEPEKTDTSSLTDVQKARLEDLEALQTDLEAIEGGERYLSKMVQRYGQGLEKIANGEEA